jgi:disulfide bond formation protein DsbB
MSLFFALLSLLCWCGTITVWGLLVVARSRDDGLARDLLDEIRRIALWAGWIVALVATLGSLYFSEIAHYTPCDLCWYQRICMYPLAVVLLVAALRDDRRVWTYVAPIAIIGIVIATYHTQLQAFPTQQSFCSVTVPCTARYVWELGFISLPFMALTAFVFILTMVLIAREARVDELDTDEDEEGALVGTD